MVINVFMSVVRGNGAKHVTFQMAAMVKKLKKESRVLVVDFDLESPHLASSFFSKDEVRGLDRLIEQMNTPHFVEDVMFKDQILETPIGIDVLRGAFLRRNLTKEHVHKILSLAKLFYDEIFIVTASKSNQVTSVVSLMRADRVFLITRNNHANIMRLDWVLGYVDMYSSTKERFAIYNYKNMLSHVDLSEKLHEHQYQILGILDFSPHEVDHGNLLKKKLFSSLNDVTYKKMAMSVFVPKKQKQKLKRTDKEISK